ncbi:MAG: thrombospondin type 3 repeat-containing protein, partial [Chloroflexi bacterium]|nr:thrombospondin type 3 repeat-containing protein [Chloroflexota bacterium]
MENPLDPCPFTADPGWDPRASSAVTTGDADGDGLPASCDPDDGHANSDQDMDGFQNRQDNCPLVANFYPVDRDRDGLGDHCDPFPEDATDGGASHRHDVCVASTLTVGSPPPGEPPPFTCPSGPDLPIPPVLDLYPEESYGAVGTVHSAYVSLHEAGYYEPIPAVTVQFTVTGANPTSGVCLTDNYGNCTFNYLGANPGLDTIEATATVDGIALSATATIEWLLPPPNDDFAAATAVAALPFSDSQNTIAAGRQSGEPWSCGYIDNTVWYAFTPAEDTLVWADAAGSTFPVVIAAYTGSSLSSLQL